MKEVVRQRRKGRLVAERLHLQHQPVRRRTMQGAQLSSFLWNWQKAGMSELTIPAGRCRVPFRGQKRNADWNFPKVSWSSNSCRKIWVDWYLKKSCCFFREPVRQTQAAYLNSSSKSWRGKESYHASSSISLRTCLLVSWHWSVRHPQSSKNRSKLKISCSRPAWKLDKLAAYTGGRTPKHWGTRLWPQSPSACQHLAADAQGAHASHYTSS